MVGPAFSQLLSHYCPEVTMACLPYITLPILAMRFNIRRQRGLQSEFRQVEHHGRPPPLPPHPLWSAGSETARLLDRSYRLYLQGLEQGQKRKSVRIWIL
jgi:hypothetical protein